MVERQPQHRKPRKSPSVSKQLQSETKSRSKLIIAVVGGADTVVGAGAAVVGDAAAGAVADGDVVVGVAGTAVIDAFTRRIWGGLISEGRP